MAALPVLTSLEFSRATLERNRRLGYVTRSGVVFDEELAGPGGMSFVLLREDETTEKMIADAVEQLSRDRDVVGSIKVTAIIPKVDGSVKFRPTREQAVSAIYDFLVQKFGPAAFVKIPEPILEEDGLYSWSFRLQESDPISHVHGGTMSIEWAGTGWSAPANVDLCIHVTCKAAVESILAKGLEPRLGPLSSQLEGVPGIFMFPSWADMTDAEWLFGDAWPYDTEPVLVAVNTVGLVLDVDAGYEVISRNPIDASRVSLLAPSEDDWDLAKEKFIGMGGRENADAPKIPRERG